MTTTIEWTHETWNPVVGCSKTSPGCDNCYAIGVAHRKMQPAHVGLTVATDKGIDWTGELRCLPERIITPLAWHRPRRVFVNSMSDLFHPDVPDEFIASVFAVMQLAGRHQFQVLTKRAKRMFTLLGRRSFIEDVDEHRERLRPGCGDFTWPARNIWLGVSIELDRYSFRADYLAETPAAIRFVSAEPLLGPLPSLNLSLIDWVIVGGESGSHARPMAPEWAREIRDHCADVNTAFFFKQWGGRTPKAGGRELDGRTWDEYPTAKVPA